MLMFTVHEILKSSLREQKVHKFMNFVHDLATLVSRVTKIFRVLKLDKTRYQSQLAR